VPTPGANGSGRFSLGDVAKGAAEDALDLLTAQIKLARLEVSADLRRGLSGVARIALFVPPLVVGYAFAMAALASWLGTLWSRPVSLACVAAVQIVPAVIGVFVGLNALGRARVLARAGAEISDSLQRTLAVVSHVAPRSPDA
jgi:Putative Actinobacterial Holin-X, holin superfamily III